MWKGRPDPREPAEWWRDEPGERYRELCRAFACDELTSEQFERRVGQIVADALARAGVSAHERYRDLWAPLALADRPGPARGTPADVRRKGCRDAVSLLRAARRRRSARGRASRARHVARIAFAAAVGLIAAAFAALIAIWGAGVLVAVAWIAIGLSAGGRPTRLP